MSVGPSSARGKGFRRQQRARPEGSPPPTGDTFGGWSRGTARRRRPRETRSKAPAKPVDAVCYATADVDAISTGSITFRVMPPMTAMRDWTVAQHFAIWIALFTVVTGIIGFAINPDFAVGDDATAETFIVDWNGWHAVAALLVGVPGLAIAWFPGLAIPYLAYRALTDAPVALWAALDDRPLGVLYLPTSGDAIVHAVLAAISTLGILLALRASRRAPEAA